MKIYGSKTSTRTKKGESPYAGNTGDPFAGRRGSREPWKPHSSVAKDAGKFGNQPKDSGGTDPRSGV